MMLPKPFDYHRPTTLDDALSLLARHGDDASPYAGGTELLLAMKMHFADYDHFVDLKRITALRSIARHGDVLSIGALATHAEIAADGVVRDNLPVLAGLCASIANARVRATGTIGGNLCFAEPRADPPVLLSALDAQLCLRSIHGNRWVSAGEFVTGALETIRAPDELLLRIDVPLGMGKTGYERVVHGHRTMAGAAAMLGRDTVAAPRVWAGCVAAHPVPLVATQNYIAANPGIVDDNLTEAITADVAMLDITDDEDASAEYRRHLAVTVARRAIAAALGEKASA